MICWKRSADKIGKAAIDGADFALEGEREQNVVEGIDQVAIALLRALDDGEELVESAGRWVARRRCCSRPRTRPRSSEIS